MRNAQEKAELFRLFNPQARQHSTIKRPPLLPPKATRRQRLLAERYTRISFIRVPSEDENEEYEPDATMAWLVVKNQEFPIMTTPCKDRDEASWFCWMVAKALERIIEDCS